jgi:hypothetical protein
MSDYASIAKDITAGVLAAMLSFGAADYSKAGATHDKTPYTMQLSDGRGHSSSYSNELVGWLDDIGYGSNNYLKSVFNSNISDDMKYKVAMAFHGDITGKSGGHKAMHLEPYREADGSFGYVDRREGRIIALSKKLPNGLFTYYGPEDFIPTQFGRGGLSTLVERTANGEYFDKE